MEVETMTEEEKAAAAAAAALETKRLEDEKAAAAAKIEEDKKKQGEELKQFTQAQIDEMINKAKGQVKKKYEDYDTLKEQLKTFEDSKKQKELDELSEVDRVKKLLEEKENELSTLTKAQKIASITAAFEKAAKTANVPEEYLADAKILAGINEDTDAATIEATVKALVEAKPFLVKAPETKQKEIGGGSNPPATKTEKSKEQMLQEAADKARKSGRTEDKIAYVTLKHELK
jgi:hypothetical protein